jgi:nitrogen regulatory protein PII
MKRVEVVMKSSALDVFKHSAERLGISEYDVSDVRRSPSFAVKERQRLYRGQEYTLDLLSRVKVEFAVLDQDAKRVTQNILALAAPDSIAIFALDELITMSTSDGQTVPRSRTEHGDYEVPSLIHH